MTEGSIGYVDDAHVVDLLSAVLGSGNYVVIDGEVAGLEGAVTAKTVNHQRQWILGAGGHSEGD